MVNIESVFNISSEKEFIKTALKVFRFQFDNNLIYQTFCNYLNKNKENVKEINQIPFLPITFFKSHKITSTDFNPEAIFTSSGTTSTINSKHFVKDLNIYERSFTNAFSQFYGNVQDYCILALLPSYLEREGSSLVYMTKCLIEKSNHKNSGFYLHNLDELSDILKELDQDGENILLIGVTYALLNLAEKYKLSLKNTIIMETGGMKGMRKELVREELHNILQKAFGVSHIHSEYGMTELLSQAYSLGEGKFQCPHWMKILVRDTEDALQIIPNGKTGGINVIDLANIYSCSFIATQDLGKNHDDYFEVLGRFDTADIRGCNLLSL